VGLHEHRVVALPLVLGDGLEPGAQLGSVAGERGLQRLQHRLTAGWGPDLKRSRWLISSTWKEKKGQHLDSLITNAWTS
jgi:hypothetical protein